MKSREERHECDAAEQQQIPQRDALRIARGERKRAVVAHPEGADDAEAHEVADQVRNQMGQRDPVRVITAGAADLGHVHLDDEQRDRDREHRIREEHHALERVVRVLAHVVPPVSRIVSAMARCGKRDRTSARTRRPRRPDGTLTMHP
ncbi:hypothetical protein ACVWZN_000697 [Lysobacter sp. HA35]